MQDINSKLNVVFSLLVDHVKFGERIEAASKIQLFESFVTLGKRWKRFRCWWDDAEGEKASSGASDALLLLPVGKSGETSQVPQPTCFWTFKSDVDPVWFKPYLIIVTGTTPRCPCKFFLPGVIFTRLNAKNLPFYSIIWHTVFNETPCILYTV